MLACKCNPQPRRMIATGGWWKGWVSRLVALVRWVFTPPVPAVHKCRERIKRFRQSEEESEDEGSKKRLVHDGVSVMDMGTQRVGSLSAYHPLGDPIVES